MTVGYPRDAPATVFSEKYIRFGISTKNSYFCRTVTRVMLGSDFMSTRIFQREEEQHLPDLDDR
ncbi:hypothetical protein LXL04_039885 [Taraxacum kok-saghyz]